MRACLAVKRIFMVLLTVLLFTGTAGADIGPKPSVQITFTGMEAGDVFYGALLSERPSTGPNSAWDEEHPEFEYREENNRAAEGQEADAIWSAFVGYEDPDGFYFLQNWWTCSETGELRWTYCPPVTYKLLLYYPETDTFRSSGIETRYAFDSYYQVDVSREGELILTPDYDYTWEFISLLIRIVLTIGLELGLALLFGYREKAQFRFIAVTNLITQIGLNVALNVVHYYSGSMAFVFWYVLLELSVFAVEAVLYSAKLPRFAEVNGTRKRRFPVLYALAANGLSFILGLWLAHIIPGIF